MIRSRFLYHALGPRIYEGAVSEADWGSQQCTNLFAIHNDPRTPLAPSGHPPRKRGGQEVVENFYCWFLTVMNRASTSLVVSGFRKVKLEAFSSFSAAG